MDVSMILSKVIYAFWGGLTGSYYPYINPFFISIGLSVHQAGLISGLRFIPSAIAGPLWGVLVDYTKRRRLALIVLCFGSASSITPLPWIATAINRRVYNSTFPSNMSDGASVTNVPKDLASNGYLFYTMLAFTLISSLFASPLLSYVETIVVNAVKSGNREASYGGQRIFGSLSASVVTFFAGLAADNFHYSDLSKYTPAFCEYLISVSIVLMLGYILIGKTRLVENVSDRVDPLQANTDVINRKRMVKHIFDLLRRGDVIFFMITASISGLAYNVFLYFSLLLADDQLNTSKAKASLVVVVAMVANTIVFPFTATLFKKIGGPTVGMTIGICSYFFRYIGMSYTTSLWVMVLLQMLNGLGFAMGYAAMMEHVCDIAPREIRTTMTLIMTTFCFYGVGAILANVAGGQVYYVFGGQILFRSVGIICGIWSCIMVIYYGWKYWKTRLRPEGYEVIA